MKRFGLNQAVWFYLVLSVMVFGFGYMAYAVTESADGTTVSTEKEIQKTENSGKADPVEIQKALTEAGFYKGKVDGVFGPKTKAAVRAFQEKHGLKADGTCGPKTWEKLKAYLADKKEAEETPAQPEIEKPSIEDSADSSSSDPYAEYQTDPAPETETTSLKQKLVS